jgi:hypothetical protein
MFILKYPETKNIDNYANFPADLCLAIKPDGIGIFNTEKVFII